MTTRDGEQEDGHGGKEHITTILILIIVINKTIKKQKNNTALRPLVALLPRLSRRRST
jgi:hypothetical protein